MQIHQNDIRSERFGLCYGLFLLSTYTNQYNTFLSAQFFLQEISKIIVILNNQYFY